MNLNPTIFMISIAIAFFSQKIEATPSIKNFCKEHSIATKSWNSIRIDIDDDNENCTLNIQSFKNFSDFEIFLYNNQEEKTLKIQGIKKFTIVINDALEVIPYELNRNSYYEAIIKYNSLRIKLDHRNEIITYDHGHYHKDNPHLNFFVDLSQLDQSTFKKFHYKKTNIYTGEKIFNISKARGITPYKILLTSYDELLFKMKNDRYYYKSSDGMWFRDDIAQSPCDYPHQNMMKSTPIKNLFLKKITRKSNPKTFPTLRPSPRMCFYIHHLKSLPGNHRFAYLSDKNYLSYMGGSESSGMYRRNGSTLQISPESQDYSLIYLSNKEKYELKETIIHEWGHNIHFHLSDKKKFDTSWLKTIQNPEGPNIFISAYAKRKFLVTKKEVKPSKSEQLINFFFNTKEEPSKPSFNIQEDVAEMFVKVFLDHKYGIYAPRIDGFCSRKDVLNDKGPMDCTAEKLIKSKICLLKKYNMIASHWYPFIDKDLCTHEVN